MLNQTTPQSDMRAQLEEIKNSMNNTGTRESQGRKAGADEPALAKSVDSQRYPGRQSQASRQSRTSQQARQREGEPGAGQRVGAAGNGGERTGTRPEQWRTEAEQSRAGGDGEDPNGPGPLRQEDLVRPVGASEGGRRQKFIPKRASQAVRGVHQARGNAAQRRPNPEPEQ